jgi:hypothetical protein
MRDNAAQTETPAPAVERHALTFTQAEAALAMFRALSVIAYTDSLRAILYTADPMALRLIDAARASALRSRLIDFNGEQPGGFVPADIIAE